MINHDIRHVGLIPDGNRRFAKKMMEYPWIGHRYGVKKLREFLDWCRESSIKYVTIYAFSIENFDRPKEEFDMIMNIFKQELTDILNNKEHDVNKYKIRMKIIGRKDMLSEELQELAAKVEEKTKDYDNHFLNLAIAYGGRAEIVDACRNIGEKILSTGMDPSKINENTIKDFLYTGDFPDPDLIIRTSEKRLSGFLLWQSAYSEFVFIDKSFPDLTKQDFLNAIEEYTERERRFGK